MLSYPAIPHINIRGISDLLDGKDTADAGGSQVLAADNMAAFVVEVVWRLDVLPPNRASEAKNKKTKNKKQKKESRENINVKAKNNAIILIGSKVNGDIGKKTKN
jgi:hypothetical protein